jgi:inosine-uridine nucleoside N-ribohydrolase
VAVALEREPAFARRVARLTVMGGWLRGAWVGGTLLPPSVDYNLCSDAVAAVRVLSAGIPTRLVSADATVQVWLTDADVTALERAGGGVSSTLARAIRTWTPVQRRLFSGLDAPPDPDNAAFLHDPLAVACVHDESFCTMEELAIAPVVVDGTFRALLRPRGTPGAFHMRCATSVDAPRFVEHVRQRLRLG